LEWERAAWANAGQPKAEAEAKKTLLQWRLSGLLAAMTDELSEYRAAVDARPDLPTSRVALGLALLRKGQPREAAMHLGLALSSTPFDRVTARSLHQALGQAGDKPAQLRLVDERRLFHRAAPQLVPSEEWFADAALSKLPAEPRRKASVGGVVWQGPLFTSHSFAHVNREVCSRLIARGHDLSLWPPPSDPVPQASDPRLQILVQNIREKLPSPEDIHVRHQWPPDLTPPREGRWVFVQPWEYGSLPRAWVDAANRADDVWVHTNFVRKCYIDSGVSAERVHVIPLGVDISRFRPQPARLKLRTSKRFKFLFVGGTLHRKGVDLLLRAYTDVFTSKDDVCLVIKDLGVDAFYRGHTAGSQIAEHQARPGAPEIEYITQDFNGDALPALYAACNCLVHPYRGEGFGLPIAEAMATGLPVVVTGSGAAVDFCDDATAYLLPSKVLHFPQNRIANLETVRLPWLAEPNIEVLRQALRRVVDCPAEAAAKGRVGMARIRDGWTWEHTANAVERRLAALRAQPVHCKGAVVRVEAKHPQQRVSLCMIVRNEADKLAACLRSAAALVHEMIVVDTGSTDDTRNVATRCGARVVDFLWIDDFAAARNESIRHATGDWIFWLDADEQLDSQAQSRLRKLFSGLKPENVAYVMRQHSDAATQAGDAIGVDQVRLFRRVPEARWEYRVHEQMLLSLRRARHDVRWTDVIIRHGGYQDRDLSARKLERNLGLLWLQDADRPDDPVTLYHLGLALGQQGRAEEALSYLRRSLATAPTDYSIRPKLHAMIGCGCQRLGRRSEARSAYQAGRQEFPEDIELLFLEASLLHEEGDHVAAEKRLSQLLGLPPVQRFAPVDAALRRWKARSLLADVHLAQGRHVEAEVEWRAVVRDEPGCVPALRGLGELYVNQGRWSEVDQIAAALDSVAPAPATVLRIKALRTRKDVTGAETMLNAALARFPTSVELRLLLAQVKLQESSDHTAAAASFQSVLAIDPDNREALEGLGMIERQRSPGVPIYNNK
jgi:glycosyltransferase involved in cell wall biosynthesis/tetratricopeptide (TPR) repeat protein